MRKNYLIFPRTLLLTAALAVAATTGAQAQDTSDTDTETTETTGDATITINTSNGTLSNSKSSSSYKDTWTSTSTDPVVTLTVSDAANNMYPATDGNLLLYYGTNSNGRTYTIATTSEGWTISSYSFNFTNSSTSNNMSITPDGDETITCESDGTASVSVTDINATSTSFTLSCSTGANTAATLTDFTVVLTYTFEPSGYYRIQNYSRKASTGNTENAGEGGNLEVVDHVATDYSEMWMYANDADNSRATALWEFQKTDNDGEFKLYNVNAGVYAGYATQNSTAGAAYLLTTTDEDGIGTFTVKALGDNQRAIVNVQTGVMLHASGKADDNTPAGIMLYTPDEGGANSPSAWYITEATTIDLTVSSAGWATANYPFAVELPEGLTAYTVTSKSVDGSTVYLTEVEGSTIPAGTPVLLEGTAGEETTYTLTLLPDTDDEPLSGNLLSGTTMYKTLDESVTAYVLAQVDDEVGFYIVETSTDVEEGETPDRTVKANRAYYEADATAAANALRFSFGDAGMATGISTATTPTTDGAKVYYDLNGRRVLYPSRGIYVTADGQKVFIK